MQTCAIAKVMRPNYSRDFAFANALMIEEGADGWTEYEHQVVYAPLCRLDDPSGVTDCNWIVPESKLIWL
jgi:hypothetical protein